MGERIYMYLMTLFTSKKLKKFAKQSVESERITMLLSVLNVTEQGHPGTVKQNFFV